MTKFIRVLIYIGVFWFIGTVITDRGLWFSETMVGRALSVGWIIAIYFLVIAKKE